MLATVLSPLVNAGPCRPSRISASSVTESLTQSASLPAITSSSVFTETDLYSESASEDTSTATFSTDDEPDHETVTTSALSTVVIVTASETISSLAVSTDTYTVFSETETLTATTNDDLPTTMTDASSTTAEVSSTTSDMTAETSAACNPDFLSPSPVNVQCDKQGGPRDNSKYLRDHVGSSVSLAECRKSCAEVPECESFIFWENMQCVLFANKVGETDGTASRFRWYDMGCFSTCETEEPSEPEPKPSCKDGFKNPLPERIVCNLKGGATGDLTKIADGPGPVDGVEECRAACKELDGCESFVLFSGQPCALFSGRPNFVSVVSPSSVTWFDMNCFCEEETTMPEPQPEPESSCKNSLKNPLPDAKICGKKGTATGGVQSLATGDMGSLETCFKSCKNNAQCESIVWKQDLLCTLWSGRPLDVQASQADAGWYDIDCFCEEKIQEHEPSCKRSEDAICGIPGDALPTMQYYGEGPKDSLIECADACSANDSCGFFRFEDDTSCDMYTGVLSRTSGRATHQMWYDATCFCEVKHRPVG